MAPEIVSTVQSRLNLQGGPAESARERYRQRIQQLGEQGVAVVSSTGNWNAQYANESQMWTNHDRHALRNMLADPPSGVISVGGSDGRGGMSPISAPSYPTLTVPALDPDTRQPSGTSYGAPYVAALIAKMKQVNPTLKGPQIKQPARTWGKV